MVEGAAVVRERDNGISSALERREPSVRASTYMTREQRPESCPLEDEDVGALIPRLDDIGHELVLSNRSFCERGEAKGE
jgi:hypothetical protein